MDEIMSAKYLAYYPSYGKCSIVLAVVTERPGVGVAALSQIEQFYELSIRRKDIHISNNERKL